MIDFDSDTSILSNTTIVDNTATFTYPNGETSTTSVDMLTSLQGKLSWVQYVRDVWASMAERQAPAEKPVKKIKDKPPASMVDSEDPLAQAKTKVLSLTESIDTLNDKISEMESERQELVKTLRKWNAVVATLEEIGDE